MIRRLLRAPASWIVVAVLGIGVAGGLYWFQPWRLFTDTVVTDTLSSVAPPSPSSSQTGDTPASPAADIPASPVVVAEGTFVTHEHDTSGAVRMVRNPDGSHQLEIVGLDTSDGPDLRVWLSDQQVRAGTAGWRVFDDGKYAELGKLKGNQGDQVYRLGAGVDPADFRSVSIWCKRFAVSFGAAELAAVPS
ncbi:DM13 domain-containing protein [Micromonospora sp. WMMD1120]|uniref:DM13 domain-containing protein n=1 Tax=Micromonospora sp. WMMD1120 TaxID=3016106 RepID=UPI00241734E4|nr:DM13 domain-containing protein [Micromonospora sp. WMMD1120]MDG4811126.1 DM13 domain-containing protein [Micromonospora sp. WMMD1120]